MKTTDNAALAKMALLAAAHVRDERDDFWDEVDALLAKDEAAAKDLVKPRPEED